MSTCGIPSRRKQYEDGLAQLAEAEKAIAAGEAQLKDAEKQLAQGDVDLANGSAQLADGKQQLSVFEDGAALALSMLLSSIIGTTVPILFKRLGVDPAVASGPLITTVNDLVAVTAYYGLAWLLLIEVLHF